MEWWPRCIPSISVSHQYDHEIQDVPDAVEVVQPVDMDLQQFLNHVVDDEDAEDDLTANNEEVPVADVAGQLNRADLPGWNGTSCGWKLHHQPGGEGVFRGA